MSVNTKAQVLVLWGGGLCSKVCEGDQLTLSLCPGLIFTRVRGYHAFLINVLLGVMRFSYDMAIFPQDSHLAINRLGQLVFCGLKDMPKPPLVYNCVVCHNCVHHCDSHLAYDRQ